MATWQELQTFVNASASDEAFLTSCLDEAVALVTKVNKVKDSLTGLYVASAAPQSVVDRAVLECASELFHSRNAPNGISQFAAFDGAPIRVPLNPMNKARTLLSPWVVFGL